MRSFNFTFHRAPGRHGHALLDLGRRRFGNALSAWNQRAGECTMEVVVSGTPLELVITDADGDTNLVLSHRSIPHRRRRTTTVPRPQVLVQRLSQCVAVRSAVVAIDNNAIIGIPKAAREPVVNVVRFRLDVNNDDTQSNVSSRNTRERDLLAARQHRPVPAAIHSTDRVARLLAARGGMMRASVLADRIFRRHAFGTPAYTFTAFLITSTWSWAIS